MADWKLLGEVPDSEDEDAFDSLEVATTLNSTTTHVGELPATNPYDIWEFPGSQHVTETTHLPPSKNALDLTTTPVRETLTTNPDNVLVFHGSQHANENVHHIPSPSDSLSSSPLSSVQSMDGLTELDGMLLDDDGMSSFQEDPNGRASGGGGSRFTDRVPPKFEGIHDGVISSQALLQDVVLPSQDLGLQETRDDLRREAVRLERSLRPRKPIQEHPYLLENAMYSSLIRQHGMRPVQIAAAPAKVMQGKNIQDGEFQDDSQETSLPDVNNSSQLLSDDTMHGSRGLGQYDFPSSSPPRTSPWISHRRSSIHESSQGDTDNTSVTDQDLPTLQDLLSKPELKVPTSAKRLSATLASSARKRRRHDIVDSDPLDATTSGRDAQVYSTHRLAAGPLPPIPRLRPNARCSVEVSPTKTVLTIDNSSSSEDEGNDGESLRDQLVNLSDGPTTEELDYKKRIRGVLPASWLRLDQKASRDEAQKHLHGRQRNRTPEQEVRRGLAQRRTMSNAAASVDPLWGLDESEDDEMTTRPATTDDKHQNQSRIVLMPEEIPAQANADISNQGSIIEHDAIDTMFSGPTRRRASSNAKRHPKARNPPKIGTSANMRQQTIGASLIRARSKPGQPHKQKLDRSGSERRSASQLAPRPLSILDVIKPDAPRFLRIAARTAKERANQGRCSPLKKIVRLASRVDNLDAAASLNRWKSGSISQREDVSEARKEKQKQKQKQKQAPRRPLAERVGIRPTATLSPPRSTKVAASKSRRFIKQTSSGGSPRYLPSSKALDVPTLANTASVENNANVLPPPEPPQSARCGKKASTDISRPSRPAIMEVEEVKKVAPLMFHREKKSRDSIYRKNNRDSSVDASDMRSEMSTNRLSAASLSGITQEQPVWESQSQKQAKRRARTKKRKIPRRVDVDAPQFSHEADPPPTSYTVEIELARSQTANEGAKLAGLGPYGTEYTTDFEIFPLDPGVYFHESTLLGSGILEDCRDCTKRHILLSSRPRVTFKFGTYACRWDCWNAQTSSELGIVLDLIADELEKVGGVTIADEATVLEASRFISTYARTALSFENESAFKPFITRVLDVVKSFHTRFSGLVSRKSMSNRGFQTATRVCDSLLILVLVTHLVCAQHNDMMTEKFQVEDLLQSLAATSMSYLLLMGVNLVQKSYMRLRETASHEKGLREDQPVIHSWALVMQILEISQIPRGSFWDVLKQTIATNADISVAQAQTYERVWEIMFTMLPLCEFNAYGILMPGKRFQAMNDGWMIVQQLLRQVFTVYQENSRQAPSFNNYCQALMSRCHYLVQQWGWRRSGSIVGAIFDFFGSQNLEHLRNEEVSASPRFLECLAGDPSLAIELGDPCFHVFLKFLALSIQKLRGAGAIGDVRNLVARILPNHNRQLLKEQTVHERDLAALRNHHDLLATLYWAAPPDLRRSPVLIEQLVAPETSHKEAILINIRCWNQLARFVVAKGEAPTAFKLFNFWRQGLFQKMVQQFDSAAADIQQQLLALPIDVRDTVSEDMISSMISINKTAVGDVLQASIAASLDVMNHAADLEAATFCLNTLQLQHVYKHSSISPPELNWNILRGAISTLDSFMGYIAKFKENEESQQRESQILDSARADDALLLLDHDISKSYFSMVRCMLSQKPPNQSPTSSFTFGDIEQGVAVSVRLATCFINGGLIKPLDLFQRGKYGLFDGLIHKLDFEQRQYLVLVVTTLLKAGIDDFTDVGFTLCELWLLVLVMPSRYLKYEHLLADALRQRGEYFLPSTDTGLMSSPNYECNGTLFEFAISAMRNSVLKAGPNVKQDLVAMHSNALKLVMEQMKEDLKATSSQPVTHVAYVAFARRIISLIRTHGSCTLDNFYYQISKDYTPSDEDPHLQIATMESYGLRLREGDTKVVQQVFFFLFNHFKMALISDNLEEEKNMLQKGMGRNREITQFIVGKMLPATIEAAASKAVAYPLLDLYVWAVASRLRHYATTYHLGDGDLPGVKAVLQAILKGISEWIAEPAPPTAVRLHTLRTSIAGMNLLWPSIYEYSLNQDASPARWVEIIKLIKTLNRYIIASQDTLSQAGLCSSQMRFDEILAAVSFDEILAAVSFDSAPIQSMADEDVRGFADNIKQDVDRHWFVVDGRISIQAPGKPRGGSTLQGVVQARWDASTLIAGTTAQLTEWLRWKEKMDGGNMESTFTLPEESILTPLFQQFPCREHQIRSLASLLSPGAISCRNLVVHGAEATGKSSVTAALLDRLCEEPKPGLDNDAPRARLLHHARVDAAQCITVRHLYERIVGTVAVALQAYDRAPKRCETMAQLAVALGEMIDARARDNDDPRWRFVLLLSSMDRQREAPATLLPALARLSEMIPCLTCVIIVTSPPAGFLRSPGSASLHFPPYTKQEYVRILALSPPPPVQGTTQQETSDLWARFCATVHDALIRAASRTLPSFKDCCHALWPRFTAPIVAQTHAPKEFSKLLVAARVHFQDESLLNPSIIAVRPSAAAAAGSVATKAKPGNVAELTSLLPTIARLLLLAAYLASHNPAKHDLVLFSTFHHGRKRRRGGGGTFSRGGPGRGKHRKIARKLLGSHAFVLERMMAIFEAARAEWIDDGRPVGAAGVDGDVGMALATLVSLRLLVRVGVGDMMDRSGKWRINVGWEAVRGIGRSIGVEVEEWLIE
ncbi:Mus7 MMS22 conserved region [Cordyceps militaris]|uniref:Mus7 MMS22 conserved region n=1 Tax=Cordyceps militaris TaxID=73501 RepID=A0A2H4SWM4_CORMI|nr:Mus7 MMS22 conserved region [Cordyceps militaris]